MAGIGFVLRKLTRRGDLTGIVEAYLHAILASTGPWILTILTMWIFYYVGNFWKVGESLEVFRVVVLYNFSFSLVLTGPLVMASTRYLADRFFENNITQVSSLLIGVFFTQFLISYPIGTFMYFYLFTFTNEYAFFASVNFILISSIWLTMVFISSLKYYSVITFSFILGMGLAIGMAFVMTSFYGDLGLIIGFDLGLAFILVSFLAIIFAEYPHKMNIEKVFIFLGSIKKYLPVVFSGIFYNVGIWVDKWIMWFAPESRILENGMRMYPEYDVSMFLAYLTIIPAMAFFMIAQETSFFESYVRYFRGILQDDSYRKIQRNKNGLAKTYLLNSRNILLLQGLITLVTIAYAPSVLEFFQLNLEHLSIFRYGCLGAAFQIFTLFMIILLSYFDARQSVLYLSIVFSGSNAIFTLLSLFLGFPWYGIGYFVAMLFSFIYGAILIEQYLNRLTYHTFITRNFTAKA